LFDSVSAELIIVSPVLDTGLAAPVGFLSRLLRKGLGSAGDASGSVVTVAVAAAGGASVESSFSVSFVSLGLRPLFFLGSSSFGLFSASIIACLSRIRYTRFCLSIFLALGTPKDSA